jgi:hypothetical protein
VKGYIAAFDCEGHFEKAIAKSVLPFGKVVLIVEFMYHFTILGEKERALD